MTTGGNDLLGPLQQALGTQYHLERELGGGGMSRVFVATETALGRRVVIKLLSPSLAEGVSAERFRREIQLAARLQHPHIVPLLAAGEVQLEGGKPPLLFFTMPFVEGESLRARLRQGALPPELAQRVLREVADALQYAHRQGIVHRDIKPDNILLSENHAVVTDFGVAKALTTATTGEHDASATVVGTVIGTPAYMAPEQASGDPDVGPAADLYALGVTAFEMLSGKTPFAGTTPRAILAAQLTRDPPDLDVRGVSAAMPPLVRRLLSRDSAQRPSAAELVAQLEGAMTPSAGTYITPPPAAPRRWGRIVAIGAAAVAVLLIGLKVTGLLPARSLMAEGRFGGSGTVVVADVEVPNDSMLAGAITEALRIDMTQSPVLRVMPVSQVRGTLQLMQQEPDRRLDPDIAREVGVRAGAKGVVVGKVERVAGQFVVTLRLVSPETGDDLAAFRETAADSTQLLATVDKVSKQLRRRIGESLKGVRASPELARVTTSSLAALREYSEGSRLAEASDQEAALPHLQRAVQLDTGFAMAWRKLGITYSNLGQRTPAIEALSRAYNSRERLPELEKRVTTASYLGSVVGDPARAIPAYEAVLEIDSVNVPALNNLTIMLQAAGRPEEAASYASRLIEVERAAPRANAYILLAYSLWQAGNTDSARIVLDAGKARFPGNAPVVLGAGLVRYATGDIAHAESVAVSIADDRNASPSVRVDALGSVIGMLKTQGRWREAGQRIATQLALLRASNVQGSDLQWALVNEMQGNLVLGTPIRPALLDSARRAMAGLPPESRPYQLLSGGYALAGRAVQAREVLAELDAQPETVVRDPGFRATIDAAIALAEGRKDEARTIADTRMADDSLQACRSCAEGDRFRIYLAVGAQDSAIAAGERFLVSVDPERARDDAWTLAFVRRQLGDLYRERGNRTRAAELYQALLDQWRAADKQFDPIVSDVKGRLAEVVGEKN